MFSNKEQNLQSLETEVRNEKNLPSKDSSAKVLLILAIIIPIIILIILITFLLTTSVNKNELKDYVQKDYLALEINYKIDSILKEELKKYILKSEIEDKYILKSEVEDKFVHKSEIEDKYILKSEVEEKFVLKTALHNELDYFIKKNETTDEYALKKELLNYVAKDELNENYLSNLQINELFVAKNELVQYMPKSEIKEIFLTKEELLDKNFPIGSYFWTNNSTSPAALFGGKWEQIHDRFLLASGKRSADTTGGEENHVLTVEELASHDHADSIYGGYAAYGGDDTTNGPAQGRGYYRYLKDLRTTETGGNKGHNNMPPYLVAYCWKRTG